MDSNPGSLLFEATTLSTAPQPLPKSCFKLTELVAPFTVHVKNFTFNTVSLQLKVDKIANDWI